MRVRRMALSVGFAAALAALPVSAARAQYYDPYYGYGSCAFPLAWPFCIAGAVVGTAATIATAPFWALAGVPPYGYYGPPYYPAPAAAYYPPPYATYAPPPAAAPQVAPGPPTPLTPPPSGTHPPASYAPPQVQDVYYFCPASKTYYPYAAHCPVAWRRVPTTPPRS
ncbi:MAG TPA: hypothetical protein VMA53_18230, partial [Stellaceae bacterium]|nr:hypothetical protein [Stellaceae bacterium]